MISRRRTFMRRQWRSSPCCLRRDSRRNRRRFRAVRPHRRDRHARCAARLRRAGLRRCHRRRDHPERPARDQPVRIAGAGAGGVRGQSPEFCAGPADQLARVWGAGDLRGARGAAVSGRYPGDDARWARPDRQLQPLVGGPHRGSAWSVLHALWQCLRRGDLGVHRERHAGAGAELHRHRGELQHDQPRGEGDRRV